MTGFAVETSVVFICLPVFEKIVAVQVPPVTGSLTFILSLAGFGYTVISSEPSYKILTTYEYLKLLLRSVCLSR